MNLASCEQGKVNTLSKFKNIADMKVGVGWYGGLINDMSGSVITPPAIKTPPKSCADIKKQVFFFAFLISNSCKFSFSNCTL